MEMLTQKFDVITGDMITNKSLKDVLSNRTILFFYPKDNTPWCTNENIDFNSLASEFKALGYTLVWVSKDTAESHVKFISKYDFKHPLISDPELILHKHLWAFGEKNNYWKIIEWVIRSTFVIDADLKVLKEWRNVRAKGHAERILKELQQ